MGCQKVPPLPSGRAIWPIRRARCDFQQVGFFQRNEAGVLPQVLFFKTSFEVLAKGIPKENPRYHPGVWVKLELGEKLNTEA